MAPFGVASGIERTFCSPFLETFRISKNEDFNDPYLKNEIEFFKNSFETVFRASNSRDRGKLVSVFQLTFNNYKEKLSVPRVHTDAQIEHSMYISIFCILLNLFRGIFQWSHRMIINKYNGLKCNSNM